MLNLFAYLSWFRILLVIVGLMSGIFSLFREVILINQPEKAKGYHLFSRCVFIAFIISSTWLWISEHNQTLALETKLQQLTVPQLSGAFDILTGDTSERGENSLMILEGSIVNRGAPTIINQWEFSLRFKNGTIVKGEPLLPPHPGNHLTLNPGGPGSQVNLDGENYWTLKANSTPIATGGAATGWIYFLFRGMSQRELWQEHPEAVLSVLDVNNKRWYLRKVVESPTPNIFSPKDVQ